ncbi:unnamed protein product [Owenia fusiformis]|uniref:Uncharacterized protein n=1 Tax=Owenia fusiformis TaxID=6347 RepID=A0A8J1TKN4_OWEFU|nr:unnamed protein product [Owenia fusiformis]
MSNPQETQSQTKLDLFVIKGKRNREEDEFCDALEAIKPREKRDKMAAMTTDDFLKIMPNILKEAFKDKQVVASLQEAVRPLLETQSKKINKLEKDLSDTKAKLQELHKELQSEQNQRLALQVRVVGIQDDNNERIQDKIVNFAKEKIDLTIATADFSAFRMGKYQDGKMRAITIRFNDMNLRNKFYRGREKLFKTKERVFINDDLPPKTAKVLTEGRKLKRENKIYKVWTYRGQVYVKKKEKDEPKEVDLADLKEMSQT